jgi:hypothetical protein
LLAATIFLDALEHQQHEVLKDRSSHRPAAQPIQDGNAMGAPALAFETWDPPRKGLSSPS